MRSFILLPLIALGLLAQGFALATESPAPAEPSVDYVQPKEGHRWAKRNPHENQRLMALFRKYLDREEKRVKDAIAAPVVAMPTKDVRGNFTINNSAKIKAKKAALKALQEAYPKAFWDWLDQHEDIRQGLFLTVRPTPPQYVANMASLWKAAGPAKADKYAHLLLAAALRSESVNAAPALPPLKLSPVERQLASLIKQGAGHVPEPMVFFLHHKGEFQKQAGFTNAQMASANLEELALLTGTYPRSAAISVQDNVLRQIARLETQVPEADGIKWPLFHPEKSPYYLLNPLTHGMSAAEQDFVWRMFQPRKKAGDVGYAAKAAPVPQGPRIIGYGKYGWEYESIEVKFKKSPWHPNSLPRILEDGGVCGRMATQESLGKNALGIPSITAGQPGHCALMYLTQDAKGQHHAQIGQSVTGNWTNTGPKLPLGTTPAIAGFEHTAASWQALCETANRISPADYYLSLFCCLAADEAPDAKTKLELLRTAVNINPYHLGAWAKLVNLSSQMGTKSFNSVVLAMGNRLAWPDGPPVTAASLAEAADGKKDAKGNKQDDKPAAAEKPRDKTGDLLMRTLCTQLIPRNYDKMLASNLKNPMSLEAGVKDMWHLMQKLDEDGVLLSEKIDPVFQKYAAAVDPAAANRLFRENFERALLSRADPFAKQGCQLLTVVDSFRDVGAKMNPPTREGALKAICQKIVQAAPKFQMTSSAQLVHGKNFELSEVRPNLPYASAVRQLADAIKANGRPDLAQGLLANYEAERLYWVKKGHAEDRKKYSKAVHEQIEKLKAEDRKRL